MTGQTGRAQGSVAVPVAATLDTHSGPKTRVKVLQAHSISRVYVRECVYVLECACVYTCVRARRTRLSFVCRHHPSLTVRVAAVVPGRSQMPVVDFYSPGG